MIEPEKRKKKRKMNSTLFKVFLTGALLSEVLAGNTSADNKTTLPEKCPKTQCLVSIPYVGLFDRQIAVFPNLKFIVVD